MPKITQIVSISDQAFFSVITSALEAYAVCHDEDDADEHEPVETYGNLWGYESRTTRNESVFHVVLADTDISTKRSNDSSYPASEAFPLKAAFADEFFPQLEYLGDFHSHPYEVHEVKSELQLQNKELHLRSKDDHDLAKFYLDQGRLYRVQLVTTVFYRSDFVKRQSGYLSDEDRSCIRFQYDKHTIWLKCYAYRMTGSDSTFRKVGDDHVAVICPCVGVSIDLINT